MSGWDELDDDASKEPVEGTAEEVTNEEEVTMLESCW